MDAAFARAAKRIGCDLALMRAVFAVEASGRYLDGAGKPIHRFEPHHFPEAHRIGFAPGGTPWRASLALSTHQREEMFAKAKALDYEAACRATSWGAPQIMGFNHRVCGYATATDMVASFDNPERQIDAFAAFVVGKGLAAYLRDENFLRFAVGYNGSGQAAVYARKIEDAYEREKRTAPVPVPKPVAGPVPVPKPDMAAPAPSGGWLAALLAILARIIRRLKCGNG